MGRWNRRAYVGLGVVAALLAVAWPLLGGTLGSADETRRASAEEEFVRLTNEERVSRGLDPLSDADTELARLARDHSEEMREQGRLHHSDIDRVPNARRASENVGHGWSVDDIHEAFMESQPHRENILVAEFVDIGVGVALDGDEIWVTVYFRVPHRGRAAPAIEVAGATGVEETSGYRLVARSGRVMAFGDATFHGSPGDGESQMTGAWSGPAVDIESTPSGEGYWVLDQSGQIAGLGDAEFHGSLADVREANPDMPEVDAVAVAATPSGRGYWVLDEVGGVFTFGDASYHGSVPALKKENPDIGDAAAVDVVATPSGNGYWVLDEVGGVFTFGDASYHGSVPSRGDEAAPAAGLATPPDGAGYWVLHDDGAISVFGSAPNHGTARDGVDGGDPVALVPWGTDGSWTVTADGRVVAVGSARYEGSVR